MSKNDLMLFTFVTIWIILCAGKPDILDGITSMMIDSKCEVEVK